MPEFKVARGVKDFRKVSIAEWTADHFCHYFKDLHKTKFKSETRWLQGQLKCHLNAKSVERLLKYEGRSIDIHPNELYKNFIEWVFQNGKYSRPSDFSNESLMIEFLDKRAIEEAQRRLGTDDEFARQEAIRIKEAEEYFAKQKEKMLRDKKNQEMVAKAFTEKSDKKS